MGEAFVEERRAVLEIYLATLVDPKPILCFNLHLPIYLSTYLSIYIYIFIYRSIYLFIYLSIDPSIDLSIYIDT